jgi:hypothetical protein
MQEITMPDVSSMDIQKEIQWFMRPHLFDFLVEAHAVFLLLPETLYLTVNILDRYCSRRVVYRRHYQLVACASLLIAAKYGDKKERVPTFRELRSICCQLYDEEMFMQMEWHVLQTLDYVLGHPTVDSFLQIALLETAPDDTELMHMTWYLCELAMYHKEFVPVRPSVMARSALALARTILRRPPIPSDLWGSRYDPDVFFKLANHLSAPSPVVARKYSSQRMSTAAQNVEYFLQCQVESVMHVDEGPDSGYATPSTPHKSPAYAAPHVQHGCITPPITPPDPDSNLCLGYPVPRPNYPSTPSPVPSHHRGQYFAEPNNNMQLQPI